MTAPQAVAAAAATVPAPSAAAGPAGPGGPAGTNGPASANGPAGTNGPAGANGPASANGPAGTNGPAGANGPAGPPEVTGPARSGTGAPAELFFEDLTPGRTFDLGEVRVDGAEMVAFARRFDPQWYHVDAERAAASHHGGLIASGFYTVSLFMRAYVDHVLARAAADASPGLEELRWLAPVRAGDRLAARLDVMGARPSTARPGLGTVSLSGTMFRLGPDGQPAQEVLRTRFRGWFTLRPG
ncbi:hypothetical protein HXZ27_05115 [Micromonospora carbonacea subsp. aurantiaca]|uniref:MaoC-like domain-containing protein n=2 Tax=Micromonospora carbonacea TaxID=47853 RepID=A0A7H8XG59_9ACTN|nr:hypothetical protein HXZ27_05115 [Micromonospora carbonacea]